MSKETVPEQAALEADVQEQVSANEVEETAPRNDEYKHWIKMSEDEMLNAQASGVLIGYHPQKGLGLVKHKETKKK